MSSGIELISVVDPGTFSRGHVYAQMGRAQVIEHDRQAHYVSGLVQGSGGTCYTTEVQYGLSNHGVLHDLDGDCSCPMAYNCKHAVALVLTAREQERQRTRTPARPHWATVLRRAFPPATTHTTPLALNVEFHPDQSGSPHSPWGHGYGPGILRARPVRPGKRKKWVNSQATWTHVRDHRIEGASPAQVEALDALRRLAGQTDPWAMGDPSWISLDQIENPGLWPVLERIVASGVQLVAGEDGPVTVEAEPGIAQITIEEADDDALQVAATLTHPAAPEGVEAHLLGTPPHGLVWADGGAVHLAPLERPATSAWVSLHGTDPVRIPAEDRPQFNVEVLPQILREPWSSDTFSPPEPPEPTLHLEVQVSQGSAPSSSSPPSAAPRAVLGWSVHYRDEDGEGYGPLDLLPQPGDPIRDAGAEQKLSAAAAHALAPLPHTIDEHAPRPRAWLHGLDVVTLVEQVLPALEAAGVQIGTGELPTFTDAGAPQVRIEVSEADRDWFDLEVTMTVAGHAVPISQVITALTHGDEALFLPDGTYVLLDDPELERLRALLAESYEMTDQRRRSLRVPRVNLSWWEELLRLGLVSAAEHTWLTALRNALGADPAQAPALPEGLHAELRPYQRQGYEWLARLRRAGLGGILADDMGLGKTVQILAMILDERTEHVTPATAAAPRPAGPWLVVAPTSVVPNWAAEAARFTPDVRVAVVRSTAARRTQTLAELAEDADVLVTSYALLRLEAEEYAALDVAGLVLDEAQHAKNHTSKAFASAKTVAAPVTFAVTGTPLENNLDELWAMSALVAPGLLGRPPQFRQTYRRPIERGDAQAPALLARLRRRVGPFLLRRTKDQVATDLPPKQEQVLAVELAPAHRRIYDKHLQRERQRVLRLVDDLDRNRVEVLAALTRLRQLAIDASLVETESTAPSSKLEALVPLLAEAAAEGHRVLVFSQFTRYLGRIAERLDAEGMAYAYLDGSTRNRQQVIDGFANGDAPVFLISLKAGGVGLNLTMADYAILADPWWNPAVEAQAVDRTHRIGQQRPVMVYRLVSAGTIEEKVLALQESKRELVAGVLMADDDATGAAGAAAQTGLPASNGSPGRRGAVANLSAEDLQELLA